MLNRTQFKIEILNDEDFFQIACSDMKIGKKRKNKLENFIAAFYFLICKIFSVVKQKKKKKKKKRNYYYVFSRDMHSLALIGFNIRRKWNYFLFNSFYIIKFDTKCIPLWKENKYIKKSKKNVKIVEAAIFTSDFS